jgi:hypothetical protein
VRDTGLLEVAGVRWWLRAGEDPARLVPLLERALERLGSAADLRSGRRKRLYRLALESEGRADHLLKRNSYPPSRGWRFSAGGSKARRELAIAEGLAERGVAVVVPVAAGERRRAGRLVECFLLVALLPGARDLRRVWTEPALPARRRRRLARALGVLVHQAHAAGLHQDDLAPNNVLVCDATDSLCLVDFERARLRRQTPVRARRRSLAKLARAAAGVPSSQRLRFLRAYAGDSGEARLWWGRLLAEAPRLARRDNVRMCRVATRDGRRFERIAFGRWRGHARRGIDPESLLARLGPGPPPVADGVRIEVDPPVWRVIYPRLPARRGARLWAHANTLAARGLAPAPLAVLSDRERTLLILELPAGARRLGEDACGPAERRAAAHLLAELGALGTLGAGLGSDVLALVRSGSGRLRALLVTPDSVRFRGSAGGGRSRSVALRLLASLAATE